MVALMTAAGHPRVRDGLLMACLLLVSGCWEQFAGPALENGFPTNVRVELVFNDTQRIAFELPPGGTYVQRPPGKWPREVVVYSLDGTQLLRARTSELEPFRTGKKNVLLKITPAGLKAGAVDIQAQKKLGSHLSRGRSPQVSTADSLMAT